MAPDLKRETPDTKDPTSIAVLDAVRQCARVGVSEERTALAVGVSLPEMRRWLAKGRAGVPGYVYFAVAHDTEEGRGVKELLGAVHQAANTGDWKAAAWLLERRYGYTSKTEHEITAPDTGATDEAEVTHALLEIVRARGKAQGGQ